MNPFLVAAAVLTIVVLIAGKGRDLTAWALGLVLIALLWK